MKAPLLIARVPLDDNKLAILRQEEKICRLYLRGAL